MKIKVSGEWKEVTGIYTKVLGEWKQVTSGYTKINGVWKEAYQSSPYDAQIEYIQSSGTQWIDTGIIPDSNTIVQFKFMNLQATGGVILGYNKGDDNADWRFFNYGNNAYFDCISRRINGGTISSNTVYELELGNYYVKNMVTGSNIISGSTYSGTGTDTIELNGSSPTSNNRWYYVKIFKNSELVRDFIPVRKGSVGYLYDKVSKKLFGNAGTGIFTLGSDIIPIEYIENTGTSYINTEYKPNQNTRVTCDMQIVTSTSYQRLFGCVGGTSYNTTPNYVMDYETGATGSLQVLMGSDTSWKNTGVTGDYDRHTYDWNKTQLYRDGTLIYTHSAVTFQCTTNLAIFSYMKSNGITTDSSEYMKGKCYSFQIYENDVLVRDYIPVRAGSTGYLYDKVGSRLFGTGSFTLGPDIT